MTEQPQPAHQPDGPITAEEAWALADELKPPAHTRTGTDLDQRPVEDHPLPGDLMGPRPAVGDAMDDVARHVAVVEQPTVAADRAAQAATARRENALMAERDEARAEVARLQAGVATLATVWERTPGLVGPDDLRHVLTTSAVFSTEILAEIRAQTVVWSTPAQDEGAGQ